MTPSRTQRHFEALRTALALAEERRSVPLGEAASAARVAESELRRLLDAVLFLEYRTPMGDLVHEERAFLLSEDDRLRVDESHWLRDLDARPPGPETALRLLISGLLMQAIAPGRTPDLDDALKKLRGLVATELHLPIDLPAGLETVQLAHATGRSVRFRYVSEIAPPGDHEVLPYRVFSKWGHWYLHGLMVGQVEPQYFRVDRMSEPVVTERRFDPPLDDEIPEWFDLRAHERTVRLRLETDAIEALPRPHRLRDLERVDEGLVEVDVTVAGQRRLEHLLVCLPPDAEVVKPEQYRILRQQHAAGLLANYDERQP